MKRTKIENKAVQEYQTNGHTILFERRNAFLFSFLPPKGASSCFCELIERLLNEWLGKTV